MNQMHHEILHYADEKLCYHRRSARMDPGTISVAIACQYRGISRDTKTQCNRQGPMLHQNLKPTGTLPLDRSVFAFLASS